MTAFIVHKDAPGFSVGKHEKKMGIRGSATCELILKNVRVNKNDILGKEGQGLKMALASLDSGRMGIATQALGIAGELSMRPLNTLKNVNSSENVFPSSRIPSSNWLNFRRRSMRAVCLYGGVPC